MRHQKLESKDGFGININAPRTHVLLQLNEKETGNQIRVRLTSDEVDDIIEQLKECKGKIKCSIAYCEENASSGGVCLDHLLKRVFGE
jgi:predicted flavoprotein YhiN